MSKKQKTILTVLGSLIACALLALILVAGYSFLEPWLNRLQGKQSGAAKPVLLITSPRSGQEVAVGEPVMVHAVASGADEITRVELWIDGRLHASQESSLPDGTSPFPLVALWQPVVAGPHTLVARAFAPGERAQAVVEVEATGGGDRDSDGLPDDVDGCPDAPGVPSADGCPDWDGDGVPDGGDACPDGAGVGGDGCPAPGDGDRDGDGVPDGEDGCPDEPGVPGEGCPLIGDRDGDGIPDGEDACPDEPGTVGAGGCPDRDGDGTPDGEDACPAEPGPPESGCPVPGDGDRDGDGFPDDEDECPDEPGVPETWGCPDRDGDGVRDGVDECPDEPGPPENRGCPVEDADGDPGGGGAGADADSDGDGTPDDADPCPDEPGPPEHDGCPDSDGDGIPDWWDRCPDEPGTPEGVGCPDSGVGDRDGDGIPDDVDLCPEEAGEPEHGGCPAPDPESDDGVVEPGPGEVEWPHGPPIGVEFQALSFQVSAEYDGVTCYPSLAGGGVERYTFAPLGGQQWDIAAELGSRTLLTTLDEPIEVRMDCGGDVVFLGPGEGWGTYWSMGSVAESHSSTDWDGHVITVRSTGGDEGRWFEAQYRLCSGSCENTGFPAPLLLLSHGREDLLIWQWNGDMESLRSFDVYVNGSRVMRLRSTESVATFDISAYRPLCGGRPEFYVVATGADGRESPPSNVVVWEAEPCPRVVRVTFDRLITYDSGDGEHACLGPIFGTFYVQGSTSESLRFEGDDYPDGYRLCPNSRYNVQEMFDTIWRWGSGMGSSPYWAPESSSVTVELGPDDELTLGGAIYEWDRQGAAHVYREAFNHSRTTPAGGVRPGRYALRDGQIRLEFVVDVLVGPEAGREPDLTITNVDTHEPSGQLRVHVFNNASDMAEPADITVHWVRVGSSEIIGTHTWTGVQIPSGGSRILQTDPVGEIGGMIFVLDPGEAIPDGNRGNNTFETPLVMRVAFEEVGASHCSESGCSIFDCDSEWTFRLWAGYGPSESDISWVGYHVRFPPSGELKVCTHDICRDRSSPDADWIMAGDERYVFEFEMPAAQNVYVLATGTEVDFWTSDDAFASPVYQYTPRDNWGARSDPYNARLVAEESCNDALCSECFESSVWTRFRITRVR